jgi:hypothetical protein
VRAAVPLALLSLAAAVTGCSGSGSGGEPAPAGSGGPTSNGASAATGAPTPPPGVTVTPVDGEPVGVAEVDGKPWVALVDRGSVLTPHGQVAVGDTPLRLVSTPDGVWVSVFGAGTVVRVDPQTGTVDKRVTLPGKGAQPEGLAYADGTVWVVDQAHDQALPVDSKSGAIGTPVAVGKEPRLATAGPSGVWVSAFEGGSVTRVAPGPRKTVKLKGCIGAQGLAEAAGVLWVACTQVGGVQGVDPSTGRVVTQLDEAQSPDAVVASGTSAYVLSQDGPTIWTIDGTGRSMGDAVVLGDANPAPANVGAAVVGDDLVVAEPGAKSVFSVPLSDLAPGV